VTLTNARPGDNRSGCIIVSYTGTLSSSVRLYGTVTGGLGPFMTLVVTRGTVSGAFPSCTGFTPDTTLYNGALGSFPSTYAAGIVDPSTWANGNTHAYMFAVTMGSDPAGQGLSATATFTWEARNV